MACGSPAQMWAGRRRPGCRVLRVVLTVCPLRTGEIGQGTEKRPLLAAGPSVPPARPRPPREWLRGCLWAGIRLGSRAIFVASAGLDPTAPRSVAAAFGVVPGGAGIPPPAALAMVAVPAIATPDADRLSNRNKHRLRSNTGRSPACGRHLDPTLSFRQWCTEPPEVP